MNFEKIFERATIRGVADYLLFGADQIKIIGAMKNVWTICI